VGYLVPVSETVGMRWCPVFRCGRPSGGIMTLDKHKLDGVAQIQFAIMAYHVES